MQLATDPYCQWPEGCGLVATDVDHIRPIQDEGAVWDFDNLQSLCQAHHSAKTRREQLARVKS